MTIMAAALCALTGMYILTFLYHLVITIMMRGNRLHLFFSVMALAVSIYAPTNLMLYRADSVAGYLFIDRIQMYCVALFMVSLVWFASYYTGYRPMRFLAPFCAVFAAFVLARSLSPTLLIFESVRGIDHFTLPWGERITVLVSDASLFLPGYYLLFVTVFAFVFTASFRQYRSGERKNALVLMGATALFLLASINDMVVFALGLKWLYLGDFGFTSLMILMSLNLSADLVHASRIKQQLVENEKKFRAIFNSTFQFIGMLDLEGRVIDANQSALAFAGTSPDKVTGLPFWDTPWWGGLPAERAKLTDAISRAAAGDFVRFETVNRRANGALHVIDFSLQPVKDDTGRVIFLVPEGRDISENKQAELTITRQVSELKRLNEEVSATNEELNATVEELQATNEEFEAQNSQLIEARDEITQREQEYRRLVENVPAMIFRMSIPDGKITYVSNASYEIFGYRPEELDRNSSLVFDVIHPDSKVFVIGRWDVLLKGGEPTNFEFMITHRSGEPRWVYQKSVPVKDRDGVIVSVEGFLADITDLKKAEEKIQASLREKEVLLRELYHRTKNNMQVITSLLNLQAGFFENNEVREVFVDMENRIQSMAMVHQKLYQSQNLASINLKEYAQELALLLIQSYGVGNGPVEIAYDAADVIVQIDVAIPFGLVLNELISNALKHAFPGGRRGEIALGLRRVDGGFVELTVSDNGVGVPAGFDFRSKGRLGQQIIFSIVEHQLKGEVQYALNGGVTCRVRFREEMYPSRI